MKPSKVTCNFCYKKVYRGYLEGTEFYFELDTNEKHTCKYDTDSREDVK